MTSKTKFIILFFTLIFTVLVTLGAARVRLWGDEAETALFSKMVAEKGIPYEWDGVNFLGHEADAANIYGRVVNHTNPWLMYYLTAVSFKLLGVSDFTARIPSVFFSIFIIPLTYLLVKKLTGNKNTGLLTAVSLALSVQLILFSYQARYYSLLILLGLLFVYFAHDLTGSRLKPIFLFLSVSIFSFYNHYIIFPIFYFSVLTSYIIYLLVSKRGLRVIIKFLFRYLLLGFISFIAFIPYFWILRPLSTAYSQFTPYVSFFTFLSTFADVFISACGLYNFADILPIAALILIPFLFIQKISKSYFAPAVLLFMIPFTFLFITSLHTTLFITYNPLANLRYGSLLIPYMSAFSILLLYPVRMLSRKLFTVLFILLSVTNIFTLDRPRIFLFEYISEMVSPYTSAKPAVAYYLNTHAKTGDTAFVSLDRAHEPLIFFLGDKIRFVNRISPLNSEIFKNNYSLFPKYVYNFRSKPDWIILFSKRGKNDNTDYDYAYNYRDYRTLPDIDLNMDYTETVLPVFYADTTRPEIYQHRFTQYVPNDRDKIYIYKKR